MSPALDDAHRIDQSCVLEYHRNSCTSSVHLLYVVSSFVLHFPLSYPPHSSLFFFPTLPKTGDQIGREARAMMNAGNGYSTFWAPVINLAREPRWGRNIETPGEDPYLSGEYAEYFVKGMEQSPDDPYDKDSLYIQCSEICTLRNEKFHTET